MNAVTLEDAKRHLNVTTDEDDALILEKIDAATAWVSRWLRHGGHPVLRWNVDNVAVEIDKAGNKSFHKGKSRDRIDGAVAAAMAVGRAAAGEGYEKSILDDASIPADLLVW